MKYNLLLTYRNIYYIILNNIKYNKGVDKMYGYIYMTTNKVNNKKYIGMHKSEKFDETYFGSGKKFYEDFKKYGKSNFDCIMIDTADTENELCEKEIYYIEKYNAVESNEFYNIHYGGHGGDNYSHKSDEEKEELKRVWRERLSGVNNPMYGRDWREGKSDEELKRHKEKISWAVKKRYENYEERKRTSEKSKEVWSRQGFKDKMSELHKGENNGMYGKRHSQSSLDKMKKTVKINLINGEVIIIHGYKDAVKYMKERFGISDGTFDTWFEKPYKTHYKKYKHLNGSTAEYIEK